MFLVYLSIIFFFFKQKTAYEMRISDWSSDVCSSDLRPGRAAAWLCPHQPRARRRAEVRTGRSGIAAGRARRACPRPRAAGGAVRSAFAARDGAAMEPHRCGLGGAASWPRLRVLVHLPGKPDINSGARTVADTLPHPYPAVETGATDSRNTGHP